MKEIIMLKPHFVEKVWGGDKLRAQFNYDIPSNQTGECWAISAHKNGQSIVASGKHQGKLLSEIYSLETGIFGNNIKDEFPLLVKILDAKEDLSIQVHPGVSCAKLHDNDLGKTECWYILDAKDNADIIMGHHAKNKEEVKEMIVNNRWKQFLNVMSISSGDFFYVKTGTVHALRSGTLIYELQQSSDTTYRLYDYERMENGKLRELHIDKAIDVIYAPQKIVTEESRIVDNNVSVLTNSKFFTLYKIENLEKQSYMLTEKYLLASVIEGSGKFDDQAISKGDHFIIPFQYGKFTLEGEVTLLLASE